MNERNHVLPTLPPLSFAPRRLTFPATSFNQTGSTALATQQSLPDLIERSKNSVVRIETPSFAFGSGFIVEPSGYILTNAHVLSSGGALTVRFEDGRSFTPRLVHYDAESDIALLKIDSLLRFQSLPLAQNARDGENVLALGYPGGLLNACTTRKGIISAQRQLGSVTWIQTDAAINPGDSGGPLLNERGEVIGMNTGRWPGSRNNSVSIEGMNYAISYQTLSVRFNEMIVDELISSISRLDLPSLNAFGPTNGSLSCNPINSALLNAHVDVNDFVVEANFVTPINAKNSGWRAGFVFGHRILPRQPPPSRLHFTYVYDSGVSVHGSKSESERNYTVRAASYSTSIETGPGAINNLRVLVAGSTGWFFINGECAIQLDISGRATPGQIAVFATANLSTGPTRFFNFRVRPLSMFQ